MEQKKKHSHDGHRQRMKNKALKGGIYHWPEHEVLELILMYSIPYKDVNPIAHDLIERFGNLAGVFEAGFDNLSKIVGVGEQTAIYLSLFPEILKRYQESKDEELPELNSIAKCVEHFNKINKIKDNEDFYVFCLDSKQRLVKTIHIKGSENKIDVPLTKFAKEIAQENHKSMIIMHSHPTGSAHPSSADVLATRRLEEAGIAVGVLLHDHIIVNPTEYFSFKRADLL